MECFRLTDTLFPTYAAVVVLTAQVPSNVHISPATLGEFRSSVLTDTVCTTHAAAVDVSASVCIQTL